MTQISLAVSLTMLPYEGATLTTILLLAWSLQRTVFEVLEMFNDVYSWSVGIVAVTQTLD